MPSEVASLTDIVETCTRFAVASLTDSAEPRARFAVALTVDAPVAASEPPQRCPRTGALVVKAPLTWSGMRRVPWQGKMLRMYRAEGQVNSESYRKTLRGLIATLGHPDGEIAGKPAPGFVHALAGEADAPTPPPGYAWVKPASVSVGYTGDELSDVTREGFTLPAARVYITDAHAQSLVLAGLTQTSLGHISLLDFTPKSFKDPITGEQIEYDVEQVLDATDPRIAEAVAAGLVPETFIAQIGGNHFAVAIALGRGLGQAELEAIGLRDAAPGEYALAFRITSVDTESPATMLHGVLWPDRSITVRGVSGEPVEETRYDSLEGFAEAHLLRGGSRIEFATTSAPPEIPKTPTEPPAPELPPALLESHQHDEEPMKTYKFTTTAKTQAPILAALQAAKLSPAAIGDQAITVELPDSIDIAALVPAFTSFAEGLAAAQSAVMDAQNAATAAQQKLAENEVAAAQNAANMDSLRAEAEAGRAVLRKSTIDAARSIATIADAEIDGKSLRDIKRAALVKIAPTMAGASDAIVDTTFDFALKNAEKNRAAAASDTASTAAATATATGTKSKDDLVAAGGSDAAQNDKDAGVWG